MLTLVDVDSTLYDAESLFSRVAHEVGIDYPAHSPRWFRPEEFGSTKSQLKNMFRKCHSRDCIMTMEPYEGAVEVINHLLDLYPKMTMAYVSDRHQQNQGALEDWLRDNGLLDHRQTVIASSDKRAWIREVKPKLVIDDRVRTIIMARYEVGAYCCALEQPHNVNLTNEVDGVYVCKNWHEIGETVVYDIMERMNGEA